MWASGNREGLHLLAPFTKFSSTRKVNERHAAYQVIRLIIYTLVHFFRFSRAGKSDLGGARANQYPSEVAPKPPPWQQASYRMSGASLLEYRSGRMHIAKRCIIQNAIKYTRKFQRHTKNEGIQPVSELTTHPRPAPCKSPFRTPYDLTD